ncbi:APC family permease [Tumebacillus permanentifrigoris]|uniref:Amino acid transporter n=1 Tax=Tumebacillus permanentifrigoris TaxID=378543 RepID=A0A316DE28_9BACL|nr:APC family permease [Tumebacillus permanentifrigoris]PWK16461.1 amino acid transporter [Tumebacillus permanentifrigoris]
MSSTELSIQRFGYQQELRRTLSLTDLVIYGMVFMAPLAPMQVYGLVAHQSYGMTPLVYIVGVLAMLFTAMSYAHMSREFPIAGSVYSYIQRAVNPHIGFVAGWLILIDYILIPGLMYAFSAVWMEGIVPGVPAQAWGVLFILINTFISVRGITLTARANFFMFWLQIATLVAFFALGVKFVFIDGHGTGGFSMAPLFQAEHFNVNFIATATTIAVLGFLGFDGISTLAEEAKDPVRTVGKATVLSLIVIGVLFLGQTYMAALVHPAYEGLDPDMGFFDIARESGGDVFYVLLILVNVIAMGGAVTLNVQAATSRVLYSMSRDNLLPFSSFFRRVHPKYQTPIGATFFSAGVSLFILFALPIETIIKFVNFGATTSFMMLNFSVFYYFFLKKKRRDLKSIFKFMIFPLAGLFIVGYVWSGFDPVTFYVGFGWIAVGIVFGAVKSKGYRELPPTLQDL